MKNFKLKGSIHILATGLLDKGIGGGFGIMLDDLIAGTYAAGILYRGITDAYGYFVIHM